MLDWAAEMDRVYEEAGQENDDENTENNEFDDVDGNQEVDVANLDPLAYALDDEANDEVEAALESLNIK